MKEGEIISSCPLVNICGHVLTCDASVSILPVASDFKFLLEEALSTENLVKLNGSAVAASDDENGVRVC